VDFEHSDVGSKGIGMVNVNSRVKLYYGSKYGLSITSIPGVETLIRVHIPAVQ
jgi:two-component system sensor histidine kinase YesM